MKNFKLLLASTAILSTTAIAAFAGVVGQDSLTVPISAEVIRPISLGYTQALDFGRIVMGEDYSLSVSVNATGNTTISGPGTLKGYVLTQGKAAIITGATCSQIQLPNLDIDDGGAMISLSNPTGAPSTNKATISTLICDTNSDGDTVIFGTLTFSNDGGKAEGETYGTVYPGVYTGEFTITAIYHDDPRATNNNGSGS